MAILPNKNSDDNDDDDDDDDNDDNDDDNDVEGLGNIDTSNDKMVGEGNNLRTAKRVGIDVKNDDKNYVGA